MDVHPTPPSPSENPSTSSYYLIPKRVVYSIATSSLNEAEMKQGIDQVVELLLDADTPVHLITDMSQVKNFSPRFLASIRQIQANTGRVEMGWVVLITNNSLIRFFGLLVEKVIKEKVSTVGSLDDALALLRKVDPQLFKP